MLPYPGTYGTMCYLLVPLHLLAVSALLAYPPPCAALFARNQQDGTQADTCYYSSVR